MKKVIIELVENVGYTLEAATNGKETSEVAFDLELASAIYSGDEHAS